MSTPFEKTHSLTQRGQGCSPGSLPAAHMLAESPDLLSSNESFWRARARQLLSVPIPDDAPVVSGHLPSGKPTEHKA